MGNLSGTAKPIKGMKALMNTFKIKLDNESTYELDMPFGVSVEEVLDKLKELNIKVTEVTTKN